MNVNLRSLIGKLNRETKGTVEAAAGLCLSRTHYNVEIEHYLMKLLDVTDSDCGAILKHYGVDRARLAKDLTAGLDRLKSGNARTPNLSPSLVQMLTSAWTLASVEFDEGRIRSGHSLLALLSDPELARMAADMSPELGKIQAEDLRKDFHTIVGDSAEAGGPAAPSSGPSDAAQARGGGKTPNLDQYTLNLTERARKGEIDPVLGRDFEIRQIVDILTRRRQNNPILVGEAGVGKTAVVEGFASRIAEGDVPPVLKNVTIRTLDLALLQAGAGVKGEFENRLKGLIDEVKSSPTPIILFIDEAHTMIGAGGQAGQNDAANLLKPALARGELRTIAATTWSEYKKYFEKDPALARRFQLVNVQEPVEDTCLVMMRGIVPSLEGHHGVRILDDAVDAAVRLSHRYLSDRQLPDKAVSVLDTACARLSLGQNATPPAIEYAQRRLADLSVQERVLRREGAVGIDHSERLATIAEARQATEAELEGLMSRWDRERDLVMEVRAIRHRLEKLATSEDGAAGEGPAEDEDSELPEALAHADADTLRAHLSELMAELESVQGEEPLVPVTVDAGLVGEVISGWTGIPVGKMLRDDVEIALGLEDLLAKRVIGQDHALEMISRRIRTSKASIEDPDKPVGVFMLVGPSGVGKTETALALSDLLYGGERNLITINMSEYQEAHTVSSLKGSPPGYVGYGEGGVLTEAVRRRPYSVVLLDEIEKAHPDVLELFFQVFDKGVMEDGEGRQINFRNCIIVLTTNAGTETIMTLTADPETMPSESGLAKALKPELDTQFKPAFMGRTVVIPYFPVRDEVLKTIIGLKVGKVQRRLMATHGISLILDEGAVDAIAARCTEVESGARNIDNILTNTLLPAVSTLLLENLAQGDELESIQVVIGENGNFDYLTRSRSPAAGAPA
jgi:type VI secretion system protein VasG